MNIVKNLDEPSSSIGIGASKAFKEIGMPKNKIKKERLLGKVSIKIVKVQGMHPILRK